MLSIMRALCTERVTIRICTFVHVRGGFYMSCQCVSGLEQTAVGSTKSTHFMQNKNANQVILFSACHCWFD